jgi:hypothetical protein
MNRNEGSALVRTANARVLRFVSRAYQLRLRGQRNYSRYMRLTKGFVKPDGSERAQWQKESAQDAMRDAEWNQRHGPIPGGARILHFCYEIEKLVRHSTSAGANMR